MESIRGKYIPCFSIGNLKIFIAAQSVCQLAKSCIFKHVYHRTVDIHPKINETEVNFTQDWSQRDHGGRCNVFLSFINFHVFSFVCFFSSFFRFYNILTEFVYFFIIPSEPINIWNLNDKQFIFCIAPKVIIIQNDLSTGLYIDELEIP